MSELPKGWVEAKLEDVVDILDSIRKPVSNKERMERIEGKIQGELYPYYGATGQAGVIDDFLFDEELVALGEDGVPFFDPKKHKAYMLYGKTWVNNHAHVLRGSASGILNKYLCEFLNQFDYLGYVNGATRLKLTQASMRKIPISLAPLAEQKRIVAKLDEVLAQVDTIKARLERIPAILKRFRQSVLAAAVSGKLTEEWRERKQIQEAWREVILKDLTLSISDGDHQAPPKAESGVPFLVISNVSSGFIDFQKITRWVPKEYFGSLKDVRVPKKGDLLYTVTGSFGIPVKVDTDTNFCFQRHIAIIKVNREIVSRDFLYYWLLSPIAFMQAESTATGTAQKTVSLTSLRNFDFNLPRLEEQKEIVRLVDQYFAFADTIEAQVKKAQARVDNLTQSILAKAFRGELVAQDPNDEPADKLLEHIAKARTEAEQLAKAAKKAVKSQR
ncbi:restriction endonuclease subunit S [Vibrio metschnikovii]|uniref:restriction endonuclease subunit S n=1 Tax=Vibrio metschnikovii TaxID=28172 RepID=UPI001C30FF55|nr:restriction endonuclease subunit S [Vibrio metschnikovii]